MALNSERPNAVRNARARFRPSPIEGYDEAEGVTFVDRRGNNVRGIKCRECGEVIRRNMCGLHRFKHSQRSSPNAETKPRREQGSLASVGRRRRQQLRLPEPNLVFQPQPPVLMNSLDQPFQLDRPRFQFDPNGLPAGGNYPNRFDMNGQGNELGQNHPQIDLNDLINDEDGVPRMVNGGNGHAQVNDQPQHIPVVELSIPVPNNPQVPLNDRSVDGSGFPLGFANPDGARREDSPPPGPVADHVLVGPEGDQSDVPAFWRREATIMFWGDEMVNDENQDPNFEM